MIPVLFLFVSEEPFDVSFLGWFGFFFILLLLFYSHLLGIIGDQQCLLFLKISITLLFPGTLPQGTIHLVQSVALLTD